MLAFVQIKEPQIDGDATEQNHKNWIEVDHIDYQIKWGDGVRATASTSRLNGEPNHPGLAIRKPIDKSSPLLRQYCASGERLGTVTLDIVNLAGKGVKAHQIVMAPAFVSSIEIVTESTTSDGAPPENTLYEDVQFRYGTIRWENTSSGSTGGTSKGSWDLGEKKPLS